MTDPTPANRSRSSDDAVLATGLPPLVEVIATGIGWDDKRPHTDVDLLACGHALTGATDRIGRRYPARRRCKKCAKGLPPHIDADTMKEARA